MHMDAAAAFGGCRRLKTLFFYLKILEMFGIRFFYLIES